MCIHWGNEPETIDIGNPLYFCYWLHSYLVKGGRDFEKIQEFVEIPIKEKRGMGDIPNLTEPYQYKSGLINDVIGLDKILLDIRKDG